MGLENLVNVKSQKSLAKTIPSPSCQRRISTSSFRPKTRVSHIAVSLGTSSHCNCLSPNIPFVLAGRPMLHLRTFSISPFHCLNLTPVDCPILKLPTRRCNDTKPRAVVVKAITRHDSSAQKSEVRDDNYYQEIEEEEEATKGFSSSGSGYGRREEETKYDRDPEFADIVGSFVDDPQKGRSKVEERLKKKRNKMLHTKTGSAEPMQVKFNKFDFSNSCIWFEFYNTPLEKDVSLISDTIRSWHIMGRLGGCNSMNMQLSQSPLDKKPSYDAIQGANVTPTTFYNIGDLEVQDNLARVWVDIGTTEPLLLDVLINALTQISSDYIGIKQLVFGGSEFEQWKDGLTSEDAGCSTHKI